MSNSKKILVAPLDWGLGHASRCIPLIETCLHLGHRVVLAGEGESIQLLQEAFPSLEVLPLRGYRIHYASNSRMLPIKLLLQIPRLLNTIRQEHLWLQRMIAKHQFDLIISDNRYGLFSTHIPCFFITHQVNILIPQSAWLQTIINKINHWFIRKYAACLIADYEGGQCMAGTLSAAESITSKYYLGNLSRFTQPKETHYVYDLLILLSGPEPQRSILERLIRKQATAIPITILMVVGKPGSTECNHEQGNLHIRSHLPKLELQQAILQSKHVIARAGYSTIMDLMKLQRHAVLIPTPGQTEQVYLARFLSDKKWFLSSDQNSVSLPSLMAQLEHQHFNAFPDWDLHRYQTTLRAVISEYL